MATPIDDMGLSITPRHTPHLPCHPIVLPWRLTYHLNEQEASPMERPNAWKAYDEAAVAELEQLCGDYPRLYL